MIFQKYCFPYHLAAHKHTVIIYLLEDLRNRKFLNFDEGGCETEALRASGGGVL